MNTNNESKTLTKSWELVNFCEFDKYAIKSYCAIHNVDESLNLGDITKVDETKLDDFNMICGGSPCQDFSVAGKQKGSVWTCKECGHEYNPLTVHWSERDKCPNCKSENIEKTRSSLLVEYLRVIRANKPNFGIYENVKNIVGKQFKDTTFKLFTDELEEYGYNVYWKVLNAKNYGVPQNRERVYLIFIKKDLDNGEFKFPEPFDNGLRLKDLLEDEVDEKFYISDDRTRKFISNIEKKYEEDKNDKFVCEERKYEGIRTFKGEICGALRTIDSCGDKRVVEIDLPKENKNVVKQIGNIVNTGNWDNPQVGRVYDANGCSPTLNTCSGGGHEPKIITGVIKSQKEEFTKETNYTNTLFSNSKTRIGRIQDNENTCPTITTTEAEICRIEPKERFFKQALETLNENDCKPGDTINAFNKHVDKTGFSPTLTTRPEGFKTAILPVTDNIRIRKLTPKECFRLMGFSDRDFDAAQKAGISNSQLYKQAGNSIVVDVLYYIYRELYIAMPYLFDNLKLSSFFSGIGAFEIALDRLYQDINFENFTKSQMD